jgi:hypothetical protein
MSTSNISIQTTVRDLDAHSLQSKYELEFAITNLVLEQYYMKKFPQQYIQLLLKAFL